MRLLQWLTSRTGRSQARPGGKPAAAKPGPMAFRDDNRSEHHRGAGVASLHYDGSYLIAGGADAIVTIRDPRSLQILQSLSLESCGPPRAMDELRAYYCVCSLAANAEFIFAGTDSGRIQIWARSTLLPKATLSQPDWDYLAHVATSERFLIAAHYRPGQGIAIWNPHTLEPLAQIRRKGGDVTSVHLSHNLLLVGTSEDIEVYSLPKFKMKSRLTGHEKGVGQIYSTPTQVISTDGNSNILFWNPITLKSVGRVARGKFSGGTVPVCANDRIVATDWGEQQIRIAELTNPTNAVFLRSENKFVNALALTEDSLIAAGHDCLQCWDLSSYQAGPLLRFVDYPHYGPH